MILLVDFVVINLSLILKFHSFWSVRYGKTLIDVAARQLNMRAHDKVEVFDIYNALKLPSIYED